MSGNRSAWTYIGFGCLLVVVACTCCVVGAGFMMYRVGKTVSDGLRDPATRDEQARRILGVDQLPDGYHTEFALRAPLSLLEVAILTNRPPDAAGRHGAGPRRTFAYVTMHRSIEKQQALSDYFEGRSEDTEILRQAGIRIDADEIVSRGVIASGKAELLYFVQRGHVAAHGVATHGLSAITLIRCPDDDRLRIAAWSSDDRAGDSPADQIDVTGTPADENAIAAFLGQFPFCS